MDKLGLYVHLPFCAKKCPYCDFYSIGYSREKAASYVRAVELEMRSFAAERLLADTLYFGGGTPSLLPPELLAPLPAAARESFMLVPDTEITLEANPNTIFPSRLKAWKSMGINRLSFGMQSAEETELEALGRMHSADQAASAVRMARAEGFENLSLDVMLGTPGQTPESALHSLEFAVSLPITHLSAYMLKAEPGTPYWGSPLLARCADEDTLAELYLKTVSFLEARGFRQYEISNFAIPGYESRHNKKYWLCKEYLGFGAAAHSFFQGRRYGYARDIEAYISAPGGHPIEVEENAGTLEEKIFLGLRLREGIPLFLLESLPADLLQKFLGKARLLEQAGYAFLTKARLALTPRGLLVSNSILAELLQILPEQA